MSKKKISNAKMFILLGIVFILLIIIILPPMLRMIGINDDSNSGGTFTVDEEKEPEKEVVPKEDEKINDDMVTVYTDEGTKVEYPKTYVDPYANDELNKKLEKYKSGSIECQSTKDEKDKYKIYYEKAKLIKYDLTVHTTKEDIRELKQDYGTYEKRCKEVNKDYKNITGFSKECTVGNLQFTEVNKINLKTFKNTSVTLSDGTKVELTKTLEYNQDIEEVINKLFEMEYLCKE